MSSLAASRQRRWYKAPARSHVFNGCVFFVQTNARIISEANADLALIREHGGLVVSNPFYAPFRPTHIILDDPASRPRLTYVLPGRYPLVQIADLVEPYWWTFDDLIAYALVSRASGFPVSLMQSPWLRECVAAGKIIKEGEAAEVWNIRALRQPHIDDLTPQAKKEEGLILPYSIASPEKPAKTQGCLHKPHGVDSVPLAVRSVDLLAPCPKTKAIETIKRGREQVLPLHMADRQEAPESSATPAHRTSAPGPAFLPISPCTSSAISKTSKPRVVTSSGLVRDGQRPIKRGRILNELRDSTVSAPELLPRTDHGKLDTSILTNPQAKHGLSDIFHGVVAYLDDSTADHRSIEAYFTTFGGKVSSTLESAKYVVLFVDSTFDILSNAQNDLSERGIRCGAQTVSQEWILESLSQDRLLPVSRFLLRPLSAETESPQVNKPYLSKFGPVADLVIPEDVDRVSKRKRSNSEVDDSNERSSATGADISEEDGM